MGADIQIGQLVSSSSSGVNGETAGETEGIQHRPPHGKSLDLSPVLALIQEKPGLLSAQDISFEAEAGFPEEYGPGQGRSPQNSSVVFSEAALSRALIITT